jgi:hypothetical protein
MSYNDNHRPNILWPAILIIVGLAFLFQNLGLLGEGIWDNIFKFWPVLLILLGLNDLARNRGIAGPTFTIGIGAIFMASNLGYLGWDSWMTIWRLWPVIIIAVGLEIFIGRKNIWLSTIGVGLSLALLVGGLWLSGGVSGVDGVVPVGDTVTGQDISQPLDGAEFASIRIDSSVGELTVESLSDNENLIEGTILSVERETIRQSYELEGDEITYRLHSDWEPGSSVSFPGRSTPRLSWDLALTEEIPLDLNISLGVGESDLDLSDLQVTEIDLNIGVGQTTVELPAGEYNARIEGGVGQTIVTLPDEGQITLKVDGGVGEIVIYIPEGMAAKINVDRGISGLNVPSGYIQSDDNYISPDFDEADNYIELHIDQGIGNISIRER